MNNASQLISPLVQWIPLLPIWFVLLGGFIAALVFWSDHPRTALLTVLGLLIIGASSAVGPFINTWLIHLRIAQDWTIQQFGFRSMAAGAILNLVRALGYALLLCAVFTGRRPGNRAPLGSVYPPTPTPADPRFP